MKPCLDEDWFVADALAAGHTFRPDKYPNAETGLRECWRIARDRRTNAILEGKPTQHIDAWFILSTVNETVPALVGLASMVMHELREYRG